MFFCRPGIKRVAFVLAVVLTVFVASLPAPVAASLETYYVAVPVSVDGVVYENEGRIIKPEGNGPFPAIVLTHGTSRKASERKNVDAETYFVGVSEFWAERGFAVLFLVRRGFGSSTAPYAEYNLNPDETRNYLKDGLEAARDVRAAVEGLRQEPYIHKQKIILMGQSTGGHSVVAAGSLNIDGVIGVVNFAGGRGSTGPDEVRDKEKLIDSFRQYGKTSRIPTLWLYSENDRYFGPELAREMHAAYVKSGGRAKFIDLPPYEDDGHRSFLRNRDEWGPIVEDFLNSLVR